MRPTRHALLLALVAACAPNPAPLPAPAPLPPPAAVQPPVAAPPVRWAVEPVPLTRAQRAALAKGTRNADGTPGPRYWQNRVDYRIDAELDPATARVQGAETITYHNNSPDTLRELHFMLYQNAFAEGVQRTRRVPITGGITLESVAVEGRTIAPGGDAPATYTVDGTQMTLRLPRALPPGGRTNVDVAWQFTVPPRGAPRTGHIDHEVYVVAQWYPQITVYDDVQGWHDEPYWTNGEFYNEYGSFDVSLTLPEGWLVDATGTLQNAEEVLPPHVRERIDQTLSQDDVVNIVTADDHEAGTVTERTMSGQLTWRFQADSVRDFAFVTSNRYHWDAARALVPDKDGDGDRETVLASAFYRPQFETWREGAAYTRHAVTFHAERWFPYLYPKITSAEGPIGGMEYPMLVFIGAPTTPVPLYSVISHEVAHQWFPMMVGSNESENSWQDEGLVTYVEDLAVPDYFPGETPALTTQDAYLDIAGTDVEVPIRRDGDLYGLGPQRTVAAYSKPGSLLRALSRILGDSVTHGALREYHTRWLFKHPTEHDFFNTFEDVAGRDLDWFWHPWFYETAVLDQAITGVDVAGDSAVVTVEDRGEAPMPVILRVFMEDGSSQEFYYDERTFLDGPLQQRFTVRVPGRIQRIEIDPERWFPDVDRANNVWHAARPST